ncbi:MAG: indolepyruvate ferredoxin oxidoreductase subunit alpha [Clostridia bacterium]|nr:indolepyruvate ferredoxin oxidoreductase subunit alpha [Clostridia bacterium]
MKTLMLGNEAIARGLYQAGCSFISSYPGTPSTEISEFAAKYDEIYAEWAPNEKVALEAAMGASLAGVRSFCAMKHVGLNVAADPLFVAGPVGVGGGLVIGVADDPGMHSSQNEQDSRHYARASKIPMLEPANSAECIEMIKVAFELSEEYDTPVLIRLTTRVAHARSLVKISERTETEKKEYVKDAAKHVMMPGNAKRRHVVVEDRLLKLAELGTDLSVNRIEGEGKLGILCSGNVYNYVKEIYGNNAKIFKLGMVFPFPKEAVKEFCSSVDRVIVVEELEDFFEGYVRAMGIECDGKNLLPLCDEFSQDLLREKLLGETNDCFELDETLPMRPPVLCPGCPHRGVYYTLKKLKLKVFGDIGCYTLGAVAPLNAIDTTLCMGASISGIHGFEKARPEDAETSVAVIGDSTFMHSGITGLVNLTYNNGRATVMILDNSITAMTGHQHNPCTGYTLKGEAVHGLLPEKVCEGVGVSPEHIRIVDPNETAELEKILKEELAFDGVSVIITRRPCVLLKEVKKDKVCVIDSAKCKNCRACMRLGCPAISIGKGEMPIIDNTLCTGCELCKKLCKFDAIEVTKKL